MLINENMEAKVFDIKKCDRGNDYKINSFYIYIGFIIRPLYSTSRSPATANIGHKTIVQSAIGKQVSIQD